MGTTVLDSFVQENAIEEDANQNCEFDVENEGGGEGWHEEVWWFWSIIIYLSLRLLDILRVGPEKHPV